MAAVYNIGGGRHANCSVLEAIAACEERAGKKRNWTYTDQNRSGDHIWWISDIRRFEVDYPDWRFRYGMDDIFDQLYAGVVERLPKRVQKAGFSNRGVGVERSEPPRCPGSGITLYGSFWDRRPYRHVIVSRRGAENFERRVHVNIDTVLMRNARLGQSPQPLDV